MRPKTDPRARAARRNGQRGGRPAGEPTRLIRIYTADAAALAAHGRTTAEAVRALIKLSPDITCHPSHPVADPM